MNLANYKDDEIIQGYNEYSRGLVSAMAGDKRRYNTRMDITFNKSMLSQFEREMKDRKLM